MRNIAITLVLVLTALPVCSQALRDALHHAGIPAEQFAATDLGERVNAASGKDGTNTYLVYLTVNALDELSNAPHLIRYNSATGQLTQHDLQPDEMENCCGSPLDIQFTQSYLLVSFHDTPSAETVLVTGKDLNYRTSLYGFDFHEVEPDRVVYQENEVHFAASHPARVAYADLRSGTRLQVYPPKGDPLRAQFAEFHAQHMPQEADCQVANDPCDPEIYDEEIRFRESGNGLFRIRVDRTGGHPLVTKDEKVLIPIEGAEYTYRLGSSGWLYCEEEKQPQKVVRSEGDSAAGLDFDGGHCEPTLPVVPDTSGDNTFVPHTGKAD